MTVHPSPFESDLDATIVASVNWHELLDEGHSRCGYIMKKMLEQLVLLD